MPIPLPVFRFEVLYSDSPPGACRAEVLMRLHETAEAVHSVEVALDGGHRTGNPHVSSGPLAVDDVSGALQRAGWHVRGEWEKSSLGWRADCEPAVGGPEITIAASVLTRL